MTALTRVLKRAKTDMKIKLKDKKLMDACSRRPIDFKEVERLLKRGANPMGRVLDKHGDQDNLYTVIVRSFHWGDCSLVDFLRISDLFMRYKMNLQKPTVPYDYGDIIHPLWYFRFYDEFEKEKYLAPLKWLLDSGLVADSAFEFWDHFFTDLILMNDYTLDNEEAYADLCENLKKLFLCASYPHILKESPFLRQELWCEENDYDLSKFREWGNYIFKFEKEDRNAYGAMVRVIELATEKEVWHFRLGYKSNGEQG